MQENKIFIVQVVRFVNYLLLCCLLYFSPYFKKVASLVILDFFSLFLFLVSFFLVLPFFIADYKQIFLEAKTKILIVIYYLSLLFFFPLFFFGLPPISSYWWTKCYKIRPFLKTCVIFVIIIFSPQ